MNIPDAITQVVADMKTQVTPSSIHNISGTVGVRFIANTTIYKVGMYVEFETHENKRYKILTASSSGTTHTFTVYVGAGTWETGHIAYFNIYLNFYFGHAKEIQADIIDKIHAQKAEVPMLAMFLNYPEKRGENNNFITEATVNFAFIIDAQKEWRAAERLQTSFKETLYPLYDLFIEKLGLSGYFQADEVGLFQHDYQDNYHYSADKAKDQNTLAIVADAIEINNLQLNLINKCY